MPQLSLNAFSNDWLQKFTDPYAVLGVSVTSDDRRILKRYRTLAKILHPDAYGLDNSAERILASQIFARLVNPAYQKLKQEKDRAETLALLRFQVRRLHRENQINFQTKIANKLLKLPLKEAEIFYEQSVSDLANHQYAPVQQFEPITSQLMELNQAYFFVKMGNFVSREKRTGIVSSNEAKPIQFTTIAEEEAPAINYALRHYERAKQYLAQEAYPQAVQELRDAIKLEPNQSDYHSLLGVTYLKQNLTGMATVHLRQALKLNPQDALALKHAARVGLSGMVSQSEKKPHQDEPPSRLSNFFKFFSKNKK